MEDIQNTLFLLPRGNFLYFSHSRLYRFSIVSRTISKSDNSTRCAINREDIFVYIDITTHYDNRLHWWLCKPISNSAISEGLSSSTIIDIKCLIFKGICSCKICVYKTCRNISRKESGIFSNFIDKGTHSHTSEWLTNIISSIKDLRTSDTSKDFYFWNDTIADSSEFCSNHIYPSNTVIPCITRECKGIRIHDRVWKIYPSSTICPCVPRECPWISWISWCCRSKFHIFKSYPSNCVYPKIPCKSSSYSHTSWVPSICWLLSKLYESRISFSCSGCTRIRSANATKYSWIMCCTTVSYEIPDNIRSIWCKEGKNRNK